MTNRIFSTILLLLLLIFLAFSACVQEKEKLSLQEESVEQKDNIVLWDKTPAQQMLFPGQSKTVDTIVITVLSAKKIMQYSFFPQDSNEAQTILSSKDNVFYLVSASITNLADEGEENYIVSGADRFSMLSLEVDKFSLNSLEGIRFDPIAYYDLNKAMPFMEKVEPKQTLYGEILFEVPKDASNLKIQIKYGVPVYWKVN